MTGNLTGIVKILHVLRIITEDIQEIIMVSRIFDSSYLLSIIKTLKTLLGKGTGKGSHRLIIDGSPLSLDLMQSLVVDRLVICLADRSLLDGLLR